MIFIKIIKYYLIYYLNYNLLQYIQINENE